MSTSALSTWIVFQIEFIKSVECVFVSKQSEVSRVWTVVNSASDSEYDAIYDEEKEIIRDFRDVASFDFHVITRNQRPLHSIFTFSCQGWRKAST